MTERTLSAYASEHDITLAQAWDDMADAYGWDAEDNPYRTEDR